jgi:hypothetical protein
VNVTGATRDAVGDGDCGGLGDAVGEGARLTGATTVIVPVPLGRVATGLTSVTVSRWMPAFRAW